MAETADLGVLGGLLREAGIELGLAVELAAGEQQSSGHDGAEHRDQEHEHADDEDRDAHDMTSSRSRSGWAAACTGDSSSVPSEWIDGTQRPTKMPAVVSSCTKYNQTENTKDRKPATRNGSLSRRAGVMRCMVEPFVGDTTL